MIDKSSSKEIRVNKIFSSVKNNACVKFQLNTFYSFVVYLIGTLKTSLRHSCMVSID